MRARARMQVGNFQASCGVVLICLVVVVWDVGRLVLGLGGGTRRAEEDNPPWRWCGRANAALWGLAALYIDLFSGIAALPHLVQLDRRPPLRGLVVEATRSPC